MNELEREVNLGRVLMFARRWGFKIVFCSLLVGTAAAAVIFTLPRRFESHFSVFVTGTNSMAASAQVQAQLAALFGLSSGGTEYVTSVLESDRIQVAVIEALNLLENEEFWWGSFKERNMKEALKVLRSQMDLKAPIPPMMGPVRLTIETVSAELSNKISNQFLFLLNQRMARETENRSAFLEEQLEKSQQNLEQAEVELQAFAESEGIVVPLEDMGKEEFMAQVTLRTQKILGEVELRALRARLNAPGDLTVQMTLKSEIAGLEAKVWQLEDAISTRQAALEQLPDQTKRYGDLLRELKSREKIFEIYLEHSELARLYKVGKSETRPYRVVDTPYLASAPVKRHGLVKTLASLFLGALLGFAWALFREGLELALKEEKVLLESGDES